MSIMVQPDLITFNASQENSYTTVLVSNAMDSIPVVMSNPSPKPVVVNGSATAEVVSGSDTCAGITLNPGSSCIYKIKLFAPQAEPTRRLVNAFVKATFNNGNEYTNSAGFGYIALPYAANISLTHNNDVMQIKGNARDTATKTILVILAQHGY